MNTHLASQLASHLESLDDQALENVTGGDRWGGDGSGAATQVQCVDKLHVDGSFTSECSVAG